MADHDLVFWRCRNKEPHSSGFLCRVVLSGTKTGLARDFLFVASASRICELKNLALGFLNLLLK